MMATTHMLAAIALALPVVVAYPELAAPALIGAAIGGLLPDLDLYYGHRKTLHYPTYSLLAVPIVAGAAILTTNPALVGLAFVVIGAAVHVRMDIYGGGLELRPWEGSSDRAVYDHVRGEWVPPKRLVPYDGAPEDVFLAGAIALPSLIILDGIAWWGVVALVVISMAYGVVRKPIVDIGLSAIHRLPAPFVALLPMRYLEDELVDSR